MVPESLMPCASSAVRLESRHRPGGSVPDIRLLATSSDSRAGMVSLIPTGIVPLIWLFSRINVLSTVLRVKPPGGIVPRMLQSCQR